MQLWSGNRLPASFVFFYRSICASVILSLWFFSLPLSRENIVYFSHLRYGHNLLLPHVFKLSLMKSSPPCTRYSRPQIYDASNFLFSCPSFTVKRQFLRNSFLSHNVPFYLFHIFTVLDPLLIKSIIFFILSESFRI